MAVTFAGNRNRQITLAIIIGVLYAVSDEIHQLFVPGRSGMAVDVIIDSAGVITGVIVIMCILKIFARKIE